MHPYSAPVLNPNGSYAYLSDTEGYKPTLNARLANEGYKRTRRNDNNILYGATWKMDFLTQGLAANFRLAYSSVDEIIVRCIVEIILPIIIIRHLINMRSIPIKI